MTASRRAGAGSPLPTLRALARVASTAWHLLRGIATVGLRWPHVDGPRRESHVAAWSRGLIGAMGLRLVVHGQPRPGAALVVANHVSWLDIAALHAVMPGARFVAQAGIRRWPLIGWLVGAVGTLFIERERKRDALRVVHRVAESLATGDKVVVFPEGATGNGRELLPFHANLLQAAIATAVPLQPVALRYADARGACSASVDWTGDLSLLGSVWSIARADGLQVVVDLLSPVATQHADRRALARHVQSIIAARLAQAPTVQE